ncbi:MAG: hypothetical protein P1U40_04440 [Coxiellaceae bacterium]|nr:hypothetical protein [Coxiellaceae bacterium]
MPLVRYTANKPQSTWIVHYLKHPKDMGDHNPRGYTFKLRINLREPDFLKHMNDIIAYLKDSDELSSEAKGLDVISSFKLMKDGHRRVLRHGSDFFDKGQFTIYLDYPNVTDKKLKLFIEQLQQFLTALEVEPCRSMHRDFRLKSKPNISMRLERIDRKYLRPSRDHYFSKAFDLLQRDTAIYSEFCLGMIPRALNNDAIHQLMLYGFKLVKVRHNNIGAECQTIAASLRKLQSYTAERNHEQIILCLSEIKLSHLSLRQHLRSQPLISTAIDGMLSGAIQQAMGEDGVKYLVLINNQHTIMMQSSCCFKLSTLFSRRGHRPGDRLHALIEAEATFIDNFIGPLVTTPEISGEAKPVPESSAEVTPVII